MDLQFFLTEFHFQPFLIRYALNNYPKKDIAGQLFEGFSSGFKINFHGPRLPIETNNLKSVLENPHIALEKVFLIYKIINTTKSWV
jgi:hypothetical protein